MNQETQHTEEPEQLDEAEQLVERMQVFGSRLTRLLSEQVSKRGQIEQRWLLDMRQVHGEYDEETKANLKDSDSSQVFVNITRNKVNAAEARLQDMLFPTDDRNWSIRPTPVPQLEIMAKNDSKDSEAVKQHLAEVMRDAQMKAELMQAEIDDQLKESRYQSKARDLIQQKIRLGSGIMKGPVIVGRSRRRWKNVDGVHVLVVDEDLRPGVEYVDCWNFFPDMSARTIDEAEFTFERHFWNKRQLREFASLPGVAKDQLRNLIRSGASGANLAKDYTDDIRAITGVDSVGGTGLYEIWEYHGPISKAEYMDACYCAHQDLSEEEVDDLDDEMSAVIFFSGNQVLKVSLNPMETEDTLYSVSCWEKDESCIFGFGIPYLMRDAQRVINASWRMIMDNAGDSVSDIIVANKQIIDPADGTWKGRPGKKKLYYLKDKTRDVREAFASFTIPNHQAELGAIFSMARQLADEETSMPLIAQGEQASHVTKTSSGMAMLMNSSNIVMRRGVKNWDDDMTQTLIPRFYDWNMQNNQRSEIKGDFTIDARGSSALLVRDKQQEALMIYANLSASNQELAIRRDWDGLDKEIAKALEVPHQNVTLPEDKIEEKREELRQSQMNPELQLKQAELQLEQQEIQRKAQRDQLDLQLRQQEAAHKQRMEEVKLQQDYNLKLAEIASRSQMTEKQLLAKTGIEAERIKKDRDKAAGDLAHKNRTAELQAANLSMGHDTY